jgi:hypothetical protein
MSAPLGGHPNYRAGPDGGGWVMMTAGTSSSLVFACSRTSGASPRVLARALGHRVASLICQEWPLFFCRLRDVEAEVWRSPRCRSRARNRRSGLLIGGRASWTSSRRLPQAAMIWQFLLPSLNVHRPPNANASQREGVTGSLRICRR